MTLSNREQLGWWQLFQDSKYPGYATLIHPKRFGLTVTKGKHQITEIAIDDLLDEPDDPDNWEPKTFTLKGGSCVLLLPEDADTPGKVAVSQPWMVRISKMWFCGSKKVLEPREEDEQDVIEWEQQQMKRGRLSLLHFWLEATYFYRSPDDYPKGALAAGTSNAKRFCRALVTLGIVNSTQAAAELVEKKGATTRAGRLLNRFVVFSTHEARLDGMGQPQEAAEGEEEAEQQQNDETSPAIPMESVMGPFKVYFLRKGQPLPYMHAPVAAAAEEGSLKAVLKHRRPALASTLEGLQQQHTELPPGFFCSLIFIRQREQLVSLEDWAYGKACSDLDQDWAQDSRKLAKRMLEDSQKQLADMQRQAQQRSRRAAPAGFEAPASAAAAATAAAAGGGSDAEDMADDADEDVHAAKPYAPTGPRPSTPPQQQHSQQQPAAARQPQRKTPRKSGDPRMAQVLSEQQPGAQRGRLRPTAGRPAAAAGTDSDPLQISSGGEDTTTSSSSSDEEEHEEYTPATKKRRQAAMLDSPSSGEGEPAGSSSLQDVSAEEEEAGSGASEDSEQSDELAEQQQAAAAAAAAPKKRGRGRPPGSTKAKSQGVPAGGQPTSRGRVPLSGLKSSKGAVLPGRQRK